MKNLKRGADKPRKQGQDVWPKYAGSNNDMVNSDYRKAANLFCAFLDDLAKRNPGWIGKVVADIGLLNDAYCTHSDAKRKDRAV